MRKLKLNRTMKIILAIILVILAVPFAACKAGGPQVPTDPNKPNKPSSGPTPIVTPVPSGKIVNLMATLKAKPDIKVPETDPARAAILNDFANRLIRAQLAKRENEQKNKENFLLSPYVMQSVLAMVANGAAGDTLTEMLAVLGGEAGKTIVGGQASDADKLRALNELMLGTRRDSEREPQQLFISGSIWYRSGIEDFRISPDFLQTNADYFGIPAFEAPFDDETVKAVNDLIDKQTKGLIKEIIKEFKQGDRAALFSTLLFEAEWLRPFAGSGEIDNWFTNIDGKKQTVRAMSSMGEFVAPVKGGQAVLRPYKDENYGMLLILPDEGTLPTDLLKSWTADDWHSAIMGLQPDRNSGNMWTVATVTLPAFTFGTEVDDMIPALQAMGMNLLFDERADLSAMVSGPAKLCITELGHKARIVVNEQGTIAAAVGYAIPGATAAPMDFLDFDRPFAYAIVDLNTGVPYFVGAMNSIDETPPPTLRDHY